MTREEYFASIESSINQTLEGYKFDNHTKQMFAWRIGARFNKTYDEQYLWNRALFLSSNACKLLKHKSSNKLAVKALKTSAEIYEYLSEISEKFDKDYCYILSALCYDISGYQANALCMMRFMLHRNERAFYSLDANEDQLNTTLNDENHILYHIQLILLKKIPLANLLQKRSFKKHEEIDYCEDHLGISLFEKAVFGLYSHILKGVENTFKQDINEAYRYYLYKGDVFISHLLHLLMCRFDRYDERSVWNILLPPDSPSDPIWSKYIKLLSNDLYKRFKIKTPKDRQSIFEFWVSQLKAVSQGVLKNEESFVIQMPTSAGKTFVAEIAILNCLIENPGKKCVYVAPFRALTNEKEIELSTNLSKLGYSVSSLSGAYEIDEFQDFILQATDVLIATPEKLDLLFRLQNSYFSDVSLLVIDEGHIIGDVNERSALLEFLIIRLKRKLNHLKILFISAVMPKENGEEFSKWLSNEKSNVITSPKHVDNIEWQPTRKIIGRFKWITKTSSQITFPNVDLEEENQSKIEPFITNLIESKKLGRRIFPKINSRPQTATALAYKLSEKGNVLIFCSRPDWAKSVCKNFLYLFETYEKADLNIAPYFNEDKNKLSYITAKKWLGENDPQTLCIKRGIGIHYGDLPEPLRKAIEQDFKSAKLRILISTNTIGQGLNFPIKNLIIHSLDINPQKQIKVEIRDFWNIIGRAGRAGKETEGQIIFLALSEKDSSRFEEYTNPENIKKVESVFSILVRLRLNNQLSEKRFAEYLNYLSEPFILSLLVEEVLDTDDQIIIEQIIDNSLFKIQAVELNEIRKGFSNIIKNIRDDVPEPLRLKAFASNGFNLESNLFIESHVSINLRQIKEIVEKDDYKGFLKLFFDAFDSENISELLFKNKLEELNGAVYPLLELSMRWINGEDVSQLIPLWKEKVPKQLIDKQKFFVFLSQGFNYRIPWGITAYLIVLTNKMGIEISSLPTGIRSLPMYLKYGLDDRLACFALSIGIKNRDVALILVEKYTGGDSYQEFILWMSNLSVFEIESWDLQQFERENVIEVALKFNTQRFKTEIPDPLEFRIRGSYFSEEAKRNTLKVIVGDNLKYERDIENDFDPYAIKVLKNDSFLGYVPREFSKALSVEIDLNDEHYLMTVIEIRKNDDLNSIFVSSRKAN